VGSWVFAEVFDGSIVPDLPRLPQAIDKETAFGFARLAPPAIRVRVKPVLT